MPGGCWSAAYLAAPVTLSTPSGGVGGWPMPEPWRIWAGVCGSAISGMGENSGSERRAGQRRHFCGRAGGGEREGAHHDAAGELDLEGVVAGWLCVSERGLGRAREDRGGGAGAAPPVRRRPEPAAAAGPPPSSSPPPRARRGWAATPPSASRASTILSPSSRSAAAA